VSALLDRLRKQLDVALGERLELRLARLLAHHPELAPVCDSLRGFVDGGKRIRPMLLVLGYLAADGGDPDDVVGPALALELLHTCALVHDDVIDRADTRRGRPAVHRAFADRHRVGDWGGDAASYGEAVAILAGDLALVHADDLFLDASVPTERLLAGFRHFTLLREEVMAGQFLDLQSATTRQADRDLALRVATLKSGRYSVTRPLEVGAVLAGATDDLVDGLRRFGDPLGRAFQVRDDLLGLFGDPSTTGKSTSSDLVEGKRTLLVAEAHARLDDAGRAELDAGLGDPRLDDARAARLRRLIEDSGARAAAEDYVAASLDEALTALDALAIAAAPADALRELAGRLGFRSH
jgi:geranylgeranyl diphosphate synthase, type I